MKGGRNRTKEQRCQALADCPARRGGQSARATRTVRQGTADCPHGYGGLSGLSRRLSDKANRTSSSKPRKRTVRGEHADRPPGTRGLSAPLLRTFRNLVQPKLKTKTDRKRSRARTRRTCDELSTRGLSASPTRTVRASWTEPKTARPRRSTPPTHHRISQMVEAVETRVLGHDMRQPRMLYPKTFASQLPKSLGIAYSFNTTKH
jgi:hypothetical protein